MVNLHFQLSWDNQIKCTNSSFQIYPHHYTHEFKPFTMLEKHNIQKVLCRQSLRPVLKTFERYTLQISCGLPVLPDWSRSLSWFISLFKAKCPAALLTIWSLKTTQNTKLGVSKNIFGNFENFPAMLWERSCTERKDVG